ncbi:hypothetical protein [Stutzerimonas stutzeri]|uniref:hypothetical protein n=1 Tax=Stutzerimonas stutzeri TaxID=316 RepID=UPI001BCD9C8A|nr:hypothetical protein [Stutzerimonas stutzeri]
MTYSYADEYNALHTLLEDCSLPSFEHIRSIILDDLDDEGRELLLSFADFSAFYEWFDTLSHYDQVDTEQSLENVKALLEVVYLSLLAEFLGEDQPVSTKCDMSRRYYSIEVDFEDLRHVEVAEEALMRSGHVGDDTLAQQIRTILRQPNVQYNALDDAAVYFTMDVEEDTEENHRRVTNIIRARVLKARAANKKLG